MKLYGVDAAMSQVGPACKLVQVLPNSGHTASPQHQPKLVELQPGWAPNFLVQGLLRNKNDSETYPSAVIHSRSVDCKLSFTAGVDAVLLEVASTQLLLCSSPLGAESLRSVLIMMLSASEVKAVYRAQDFGFRSGAQGLQAENIKRNLIQREG